MITTKKYGEKQIWGKENSDVVKKRAHLSLSKINKVVGKKGWKAVSSKELRSRGKQKIFDRPRTPKVAMEDRKDEEYILMQ